jgi:hypothetical protein
MIADQNAFLVIQHDPRATQNDLDPIVSSAYSCGKATNRQELSEEFDEFVAVCNSLVVGA